MMSFSPHIRYDSKLQSSASLQELVLGTHLGGNPIGPVGVQATETWDHRRDPLVICYPLVI
jgi:hypothetical protein